MDANNVFHDIGDIGWYQLSICIFLSMGVMGMTFSSLNVIFIMGVGDFSCVIPELQHLNIRKEDWNNLTGKDETNRIGQCYRYDRNYTGWTEEDVDMYKQSGNMDNVSTFPCQFGWLYDTEIYGETATTEWDLVCNKKWWQAAAASFYPFGLLSSFIIYGTFSDTFGRKPVFCIYAVLYILSNFATAMSPGYIFLVVMRYLCGFFAAPFYGGSTLLALELVGPKWRAHINAVFGYIWPPAGIFMAGLAYMIKDWRTLQYALSSITLIYLGYIFVFTSSLTYYGLVFNSTNLGGNVYLGFVISMLIEIPSVILCHILTVKIGRKWPFVASMILSGVTLVLTLLFKSGSIGMIIIVNIGKMFCTLAFNVLFMYMLELYPTVIRSTAFNFGLFISRIGSIIAPFVAQLSDVNLTIPMLIYGVSSLLAGLLAILLPETTGKDLDDSLQQTVLPGISEKTEDIHTCTKKNLIEKPEQKATTLV